METEPENKTDFFEPAYKALEKIKLHAAETRERLTLAEHRQNVTDLKDAFTALEEWARKGGQKF